MVSIDFEKELWQRGIRHIAGVDEAGRGPLAGPVVAAAVIIPEEVTIDGIDDSKKLSAARREKLYDRISHDALTIGISVISHTIIDEVNILQATLRAMAEAVSKLSPAAQHVLVDGTHYQKGSLLPYTTIIDGDAKCFSIAAASIIAKVTRDKLMIQFDQQYPQYGFAKHKGYGTNDHLMAIRKYGPCELHRRSFRMPCKE
jgi:ribonuclease HII